jgi:hypothetical protein
MSRFHTFFLFLPVCSFLLLSCRPEKPKISPEEEMARRVEEKVQTFIQTQEENCRSNLYETASRRADSLLIALAKSISRDSFPRPARLPRPDRPLVKPLQDSIPISPLWENRDSVDE